MNGFMKFIMFLGAIMFIFLVLMFLFVFLIVVLYTIDNIKDKLKEKKNSQRK